MYRHPDDQLTLRVGHVSHNRELGKYYQDFSEALHHCDNNYFGEFDGQGVPMYGFGEGAKYNPVYVIQYALISHDFILEGRDVELHTQRLHSCMRWLEENEESLGDTIVWRNHYPNPRYDLSSGWISGMYQGQAISLYLRYGQFLGQQQKYTDKARKIYDFFQMDCADGGVRRRDENGNLWFEEYPSSEPSYVLNGFVYTLLGIYDLWRLTHDDAVRATFDDCIETLKGSMFKYDSGYWSVYDQLKKELATRYYHKNVHIPLMRILHILTEEDVFRVYGERWEKQLNSPLHGYFVQLMYRVQPRLRRLRLWAIALLKKIV